MHRDHSDQEHTSFDDSSTGGMETTESVRAMRCARCGERFVPTNRKWLPFCSLRCQQVDLAGWLNEENGLPFEGDKTGHDVEYRIDQDE